MAESILTIPLARRNDPATSHDAAASAAAFNARHADVIHAALAEFGPMTTREIAEATGIGYHAVARRMSELQRAGRARVQQADGVDVARGGCRVWEVA